MNKKVAGPEIERMIQLLGRMPGLGPRSARRAALQLVKRKEDLLSPLAAAMAEVAEKVSICSVCGNADTIDPCTICNDPSRESSLLCVVEEIGDLWALERAAVIKARYHVLGGTLSPLDGRGPEELNIAKLVERAASDDITEVLLALNATVEGQSTSHYITDQLEGHDVKVSRLAHGVPVGGELDYLDEGTLAAAIRSRKLL
ncbi:MAG: recombination mediator RecR [Methyloligellaceae bacterium]